jgi:hypothetical protein
LDGMSFILPLLALLLAGANAVSGVVMAVRTVITMEANLTEQALRLREHSNLQIAGSNLA